MERYTNECPTMENFGAYIKELRSNKGWSITTVGEKMNVSSNYISLIERGLRIPNHDMLSKMACLFEVDELILHIKTGKVHRGVIEELLSNPILHKTLYSLSKMSVQDKKNLEYELMEMYDVYLKHLKYVK